eukprot:TRINITY_DN4857_c0_g1_i1.p1 TRINITY_DN4857_c0_g1~~TRINITY_DN4857_c0_g1_i1.p1  ORF type:complete len:467 (+),score=141.58 TRINITY_DN4857_c0_g1_i1:290-1690(+)
MEKERAAKAEEIKTLSEQLSTVRSENRELRLEFSQSEAARASLEDDLLEVRTLLDARTIDNERCNSEIENLRTAIDDLEAALADSDATNRANREKIDSMGEELQAVERERGKLAREIETLRSEGDRLRRSEHETHRLLGQSRAAEATAQETIRRFESTVKQYRGYLESILQFVSSGGDDPNAEVDAIIKKINTSLVSLLDDWKDRGQRLREAQAELNQLRPLPQDIVAIRAEKERSEAELARQREETVQLRNEFYDLKAAYERAVLESEARTRGLEERVEVHVRQLEERQERLNIEKANLEFVLERLRRLVYDSEAWHVIYEMARVRKRLEETRLELTYIEKALVDTTGKPRRMLDDLRDELSVKASEESILEAQLRSLDAELAQIERIEGGRNRSLKTLEDENRQLCSELKSLRREVYKSDTTKIAISQMLSGKDLDRSQDLSIDSVPNRSRTLNPAQPLMHDRR